MFDRRQKINLAGALLCSAMFGYAIYAEKVLGFVPCPLCMFQRVCIVALGIVFLLAALHPARRAGAIVYGVLIFHRRGRRHLGGRPACLDPAPAAGHRALLRRAARQPAGDVSAARSGSPRDDRRRRVRRHRLDLPRHLDAGLGAASWPCRSGLVGIVNNMRVSSAQALSRGRPVGVRHHAQVAGAISGPHPALFAAHAEWREGVDHAGGDRPAYEPHLVDFDSNDQLSPEFLLAEPNNKIPAIIDPDGPGGAPLPLFESGAILIYLADKSGRLLPRAPAARYQCHAVAVLPGGRHRADVRPARLLPQIRRTRLGRQASARSLRGRDRGGCSRGRTSISRRAPG